MMTENVNSNQRAEQELARMKRRRAGEHLHRNAEMDIYRYAKPKSAGMVQRRSIAREKT